MMLSTGKFISLSESSLPKGKRDHGRPWKRWTDQF